MRIAGVDITAADAAELAVRLQRAGHHGLAQRIGIAVDTNSTRIGLFPNELPLLLSVLDDSPAGLEELRGTLMRDRDGSASG